MLLLLSKKKSFERVYGRITSNRMVALFEDFFGEALTDRCLISEVVLITVFFYAGTESII